VLINNELGTIWKEELCAELQARSTHFAGESKEKPGTNTWLACVRDESRQFRNTIIENTGKKQKCEGIPVTGRGGP
jgi:hypothetical protein